MQVAVEQKKETQFLKVQIPDGGPRLPRLLRQAPAQIFTCTCIRTTTVAQRLF